MWKADCGDADAAPSLFTMLFTPGPNPGFTATTTEKVFQFLFSFDDKIHGSEFDDKLCGWADDDYLWGNGGDNDFYYGKGMDRDKIMDFSKENDDLYFDNNIASTFKQLKKDGEIQHKQGFHQNQSR